MHPPTHIYACVCMHAWAHALHITHTCTLQTAHVRTLYTHLTYTTHTCIAVDVLLEVKKSRVFGFKNDFITDPACYISVMKDSWRLLLLLNLLALYFYTMHRRCCNLGKLPRWGQYLMFIYSLSLSLHTERHTQYLDFYAYIKTSCI